MSYRLLKMSWAMALLMACAGMTAADDGDDTGTGQVKPSASIQAPAAGPQAGTVAINCSWDSCGTIGQVVVQVSSKSPTGVLRPTKTVTLAPPPAINPSGNWAVTVSGLTSGDTVIEVSVAVMPPPPPGGGGATAIASATRPANLLVP